MGSDFEVMDARFMRRALFLARRGSGLSSPNPTVGCVVVRNGEVIGEGFHVYAELDHAEVVALRAAGDRVRGGTAYITLEPCVHQGRTPPCADLLIHRGIRRVVIAAADPNPRVAGKGIRLLQEAGIRVDSGLMAEKSEQLIEHFARYITARVPLVVSKVGMSMDGRIAAVKGGSRRWITCNRAREFGQSLRHQLDALLVGVGTILADDPELTYRGRSPKGRPLLRVILDSRLRTPVSAKIFRAQPPAPVLVFCAADAVSARRKQLEKEGAEVVPVPLAEDGLDLAYVLEDLGRRSILGVLVEGGSRIHWSFLARKLVDKFYFIVAPIVIGGTKAVPAVGGAGYATLEDAARFMMNRIFRLGSDVALESYPEFSNSILSPWRFPRKLPSGGQCLLPTSKRV